MLTNIEIKNFKSLRDIDLPLTPLTLFSGLNSLGKSTIIQALLLLRQSYTSSGFPYTFPITLVDTDNVDDVSFNFSKGLILKNTDLIHLGLGRDVFSIDADLDDVLHFGLEWDYEQEIELDAIPSLDKDILPLDKVSQNKKFALSDKSLFNNKFQYLSANRISPQVQYSTSTHFVEELKSIGKTGEYAVHYIAKNQDKVIPNDRLKHPSAKSDTLIDNINAWMSEISPGVKIITTYNQDLESATLGYRFETKSDFTDTFKPTNVGFGLTYVLPVITALLMSEKGSLVIIENPESHLHPAGQSKIGHLCALASASGIQVILESHSDHILNGIRVAVKNNVIESENVNTYFFQRDLNSDKHETEITPLYIDDNGAIDEWPKGFMDEWENQLDQLLN